jgi:hypothetical protein
MALTSSFRSADVTLRNRMKKLGIESTGKRRSVSCTAASLIVRLCGG